MSDELVERLLDWPYQGETMAHEAADRIEQLTAQNLRLSGLCYDLKKEVAISDALLISEAEVSLERLARAEAAEAERDRLRELLEECAEDLGAYVNNEYPAELRKKYPALEDKYSYFMEPVLKARAVLKGETP